MLDPVEILKKVQKIEITTRKVVSEVFSGEYHSMFKGQGLEFSEVREYLPGDSFREIDWNVTARMGHPYIKKFEETRELNVFFVVDCSKSTVFGTTDYLKSEYIAELTALLSFSALSNHDKVGLFLFSDQIEKYISPRKGKKNTLRIVREILYHEPVGQGTDIAKAIQHVYRLATKKSIIFVISDFLDSDFEHSLSILSQKHDVIAIRILDKAEMKLPNAGTIHFRDPETQQILTLDTSDEILRKRFEQLYNEIDINLKDKFKRMRVDYLSLRTDQSYIREILLFFKSRISKRRRS